MGMVAKTANLTYARNDYIKQGRHHVLDKAADITYYILANNDIAVTHTNTITVGEDGTGYDVKFWGDTASSYMFWDESANALNLVTTDITAPGNCVYALMDLGVGYSSGSANAVKGKVTSAAVNGQTVRNMSAGWFGLTWEAAFAATAAGVTRAINAEVVTSMASTYGHPNAIVYLQSIPLGAQSSHATMPYIVFSETATGTGSDVLFEVGHGPAATTCTIGTGNLFYQNTLRIFVNETAGNRTAWYIPLSSAEATFTTAFPIATTSTIISTCTTAGISCTASTLNASTGRIGKFVGSVANAAQGDGYGVFEMQANFSGTVPSGSVANAASFWINFSASTVTAGTMICVQNNGIWAPAGLTLSTSNFVIGMRMHCEIGGGTQPQEIFCFSTNIVANHITSLWQINVIEDINTTSTKSGSSVAVPWLKTSAGTQYYVNAYTS